MDQQKIKTHYKHIVIGGGIVGAGILRDLTLHEEEVLLIEKGDFASQTSQGSSKMLHGGIRYLENFDFLLVHEALREKKIWLKLASHIAHEGKFYLPVYKHSKWPLFFLRIGLFIYDFLSLFKNPPYKILNKKQLEIGLPGLNQEGLKGAGLYSDGIIDDSKLVIDLILDSISRGAHALNYTELTSFNNKKDKKVIIIKDSITGLERTLTCENIIFSVGPFTDQVMNKLKIPWSNIILPSKGTHLWLRKDALNFKDSMVLQTKDNRIIFVIPQRNAILVGTTEVPLKEDENIFNIKASDDEIQYLLNNLNSYFPKADIKTEHILSSTAAVRPLVKSSWNSSRGKTSRKHKVFNPLDGVYVVAGGKYTTFRVMAQDTCKLLFKNLAKKYNKKHSLTPFKTKSMVYDIHSQEINEVLLNSVIKNELVRTKDDLIKRRLSLYSLSQAKNQEELDQLTTKVCKDLPSI